MTGHVTAPVAAPADELPTWVRLLRAPNPGPMTLDGTNTWLLRAPGSAETVVVDPGPLDEAHLARIVEAGPVAAVLITHGHPDHTDGSRRLSDLLGGVPVRAVDPAHTVDAEPLGAGDPAGAWPPLEAAGLVVEPIPTPGHTADSVCLLVEHEGDRAILTGDTILGRGTTVVAHPDGNLADYLASLARLATYRGVTALPGHGPALADCGAAADYYLAHRQGRLAQVRAAVDAGDRTPTEVVARVYADVDPALWWAAEWSVRAQLEYLGVPVGESDGSEARLDQP
ncbi:MBL fold metallo-hydrolase [Micromonospora sp. NPDC000207]|uniref:MBL fold metallo-hydrolase n=1 Tax=Micromonospora sp. NPDC000207 TaxID=3154246 RepID=UPI00332E6B6C